MTSQRGDMTATLTPRLETVGRGWSSGPLPSVLLLLGGGALGPSGLAVLTPSVLSFLDPAAPVGLAVFGIVAAMRIRGGRRGAYTAARAAFQATLTGLVAGGALFLARPPLSPGDAFPAWGLVAIILGIAAATSSSLTWDAGETPDGTRLYTEDCVVPIVAGGLLLAFAREPTPAGALLLTAEIAAIALLIAASGWLLLARASTTEEQRVGTFAAVLLAGGAADYLGMSALCSGLVAGVCWRLPSARIRELIRRDATYAADSLLALVLLLAGAHAGYSAATLTIAITYTVVRACGKLAGRWLTCRLFPAAPRPSTRLLLAPGAFGVAFALDVVRALGPAFAPVLTIVVVGTVASSLIAALAHPEVDA
jgi:hypothetical protein